jgi:hypothetical protein
MNIPDSASLWSLLRQQDKRESVDFPREIPRAGNMICLAAEVHERIYRGQLENFDDIVKELESMIATQTQKDRVNRPPARYVE